MVPFWKRGLCLLVSIAMILSLSVCIFAEDDVDDIMDYIPEEYQMVMYNFKEITDVSQISEDDLLLVSTEKLNGNEALLGYPQYISFISYVGESLDFLTVDDLIEMLIGGPADSFENYAADNVESLKISLEMCQYDLSELKAVKTLEDALAYFWCETEEELNDMFEEGTWEDNVPMIISELESECASIEEKINSYDSLETFLEYNGYATSLTWDEFVDACLYDTVKETVANMNDLFTISNDYLITIETEEEFLLFYGAETLEEVLAIVDVENDGTWQSVRDGVIADNSVTIGILTKILNKLGDDYAKFVDNGNNMVALMTSYYDYIFEALYGTVEPVLNGAEVKGYFYLVAADDNTLGLTVETLLAAYAYAGGYGDSSDLYDYSNSWWFASINGDVAVGDTTPAYMYSYEVADVEESDISVSLNNGVKLSSEKGTISAEDLCVSVNINGTVYSVKNFAASDVEYDFTNGDDSVSISIAGHTISLKLDKPEAPVEENKSPATGDNAIVAILAMIFSLSAAAVVVYNRKRSEK